MIAIIVRTDIKKLFAIWVASPLIFISIEETISSKKVIFSAVGSSNTLNSAYIQDENNSDLYFYKSGNTDKYYLERIEQNWFFFYDEYDF